MCLRPFPRPHSAADGRPTNVQVAVSGPLSVTISWTVLSSSDISTFGAVVYTVLRNVPGTFNQVRNNVSLSTSSYTWTGLTANQQYTFGIFSVLNSGSSGTSTSQATALGRHHVLHYF